MANLDLNNPDLHNGKWGEQYGKDMEKWGNKFSKNVDAAWDGKKVNLDDSDDEEEDDATVLFH